MRRERIVSAIMLLVGVWMLCASPLAVQASCARIPTPESAFERSGAVFSGIVLSVKEVNQSVVRSSADPVDVTFRVTEVWKGVDSDRVTVRTTAYVEGMVSRFEKGKSYIVYAENTSDGLRIGSCTRTAELAMAGDDLAALGKGTAPPQSPELEEEIRSNPAVRALFWGGLALAVPAAIALAVLLTRRRFRG